MPHYKFHHNVNRSQRQGQLELEKLDREKNGVGRARGGAGYTHGGQYFLPAKGELYDTLEEPAETDKFVGVYDIIND